MTRNEFIATAAKDMAIKWGVDLTHKEVVRTSIKLADELERQGVAPWKA